MSNNSRTSLTLEAALARLEQLDLGADLLMPRNSAINSMSKG